VTVLILSRARDPRAGPLARLLEDARRTIGERHRRSFEAAGATAVRLHAEPPDDTPFGERLARLAPDFGSGGLVVLGAGAAPLATAADLAPFVHVAAAGHPVALVNSRYSADIVAVSCAGATLRDVPQTLASDNALPRWLAEVAGIDVTEAGADPASRRRLRVDIDSPGDLVLLEGGIPALPVPTAVDGERIRAALDGLRSVARDPEAELFVAGRTSAAALRDVETGTAARTRALVEERGLRTAQLAAARGRPNRRPPRSLLGELLLRDGPERLGAIIEDLCDAAVVDTRVLIAARAGADERAWPAAEDRFASDLLLPERITDPWLRALTASAVESHVPILLGGHTLVGPGLALAVGLDA
jgi:hypothetical protein